MASTSTGDEQLLAIEASETASIPDSESTAETEGSALERLLQGLNVDDDNPLPFNKCCGLKWNPKQKAYELCGAKLRNRGCCLLFCKPTHKAAFDKELGADAISLFYRVAFVVLSLKKPDITDLFYREFVPFFWLKRVITKGKTAYFSFRTRQESDEFFTGVLPQIPAKLADFYNSLQDELSAAHDHFVLVGLSCQSFSAQHIADVRFFEHISRHYDFAQISHTYTINNR